MESSLTFITVADVKYIAPPNFSVSRRPSAGIKSETSGILFAAQTIFQKGSKPQ
jgi:hypothetical protein